MRLFRLHSRGRGTVLGPLEDEVMQVVWNAEAPVAVSEVHRVLKRKKKVLAYSTVKAILTNLCAKRYLEKHCAGRANVFSAAITREVFQEQMVSAVLNALSTDDRNPLLIKLVDRLVSDDGTLDVLEKLIARKRAEEKDRG